MGQPGVVPPGGRRVVRPIPVRGEAWWCELAEIGGRPLPVSEASASRIVVWVGRGATTNRP